MAKESQLSKKSIDAASKDSILEEAALLTFLGEFYIRNPDSRLVSALRALDPDAFFNAAPAHLIQRIVQYAKASGVTEENDDFLNLKRDWTKLFRAISPDYGPKAPYGALFLDLDTKNLMAELSRLFKEGGFEDFGNKERIDYIGTGFRFVAFLDLQRAHALESKDSAELERLNKIREKFLFGLFAPWVPEYCKAALSFAKTDLFKAVMEVTVSILNSITRKEEQTAEMASV